MQIKSVQAVNYDGIEVTIAVGGFTGSVSEALSSVLALFAGAQSHAGKAPELGMGYSPSPIEADVSQAEADIIERNRVRKEAELLNTPVEDKPAAPTTRTRTRAAAAGAPSADTTATAPAAEQAQQVTRTRRPRTNPDAASAAPEAVEAGAPSVGSTTPAQDASEDAPAAGLRRRRSVTADAPPAEPQITDADLAKAASSAAQEPGVGPDVVMLVVQDICADLNLDRQAQVNDIPQAKRKQFLFELQEQIELAREEAGAKA